MYCPVVYCPVVTLVFEIQEQQIQMSSAVYWSISEASLMDNEGGGFFQTGDRQHMPYLKGALMLGSSSLC